MGGFANSEIPLLSLFLYLFGKAISGFRSAILELSPIDSVYGQIAPKTVSGGEFDWGGTSVKR